MQVALYLIKQYEDINYAIPFPNPIEVIKIKMEEKSLQHKDLVDWLGSNNYVSSLLRGKKS